MELTRFEQDRGMSFTIKSVGSASVGFTEKGEYLLEERNARTQLTLSAQSNYFGLLPRLFEPLITHEAQEKVEGDLARLKSLVEAEPAVPATP